MAEIVMEWAHGLEKIIFIFLQSSVQEQDWADEIWNRFIQYAE